MLADQECEQTYVVVLQVVVQVAQPLVPDLAQVLRNGCSSMERGRRMSVALGVSRSAVLDREVAQVAQVNKGLGRAARRWRRAWCAAGWGGSRLGGGSAEL